MKQFMFGAALVLLWAAMTGNFSTPNLLLGLLVALIAIGFLRRSFSAPLPWRKLQRIISLVLLFGRELAISAVRVAKIVLTPDIKSAINPAIIAFPLTVQSDGEIALLANLVTLTPGTLSVDVSEDRSVLYVHVLHFTTREQFITELADGFERKVAEVFA